jgi:hypothetical protein
MNNQENTYLAFEKLNWFFYLILRHRHIESIQSS